MCEWWLRGNYQNGLWSFNKGDISGFGWCQHDKTTSHMEGKEKRSFVPLNHVTIVWSKHSDKSILNICRCKLVYILGLHPLCVHIYTLISLTIMLHVNYLQLKLYFTLTTLMGVIFEIQMFVIYSICELARVLEKLGYSLASQHYYRKLHRHQ